MSRSIILAVSATLVSLAPAMANDGTSVPAPTSVTLQTAQETVIVTPAAPVVAVTPAAPVAAAPAVYAPVPFSSAGLGGGALVIGGLATLGFVGLVAVAAANDDDDDSTNSTPNTP